MAGVLTALAGILPTSGGGGGYTYTTQQDFETPTTGYDHGETWSTTGSPDPVYTGIVLEGTQSLRVNSGGVLTRAFRTFPTDVSTVTLCMMVRFTTAPGDFVLFAYILDSGFSANVELMLSSGKFYIGHGGTQAGGTFSVTTGVLYYLWVEYEKSTASNGKLKLYASTTTTKPGSPDINITNGSSTTDVHILFLGTNSGVSMDVLYDHIRSVTGAQGTVTNWPA